MSQLRPQSGDAPPSARHSLRWRLPLMISSLIAGVLALFVWAAHREVEQTLVFAGRRARAGRRRSARDDAGPARRRAWSTSPPRRRSGPRALPADPADETDVTAPARGCHARLERAPGDRPLDAAGEPLITMTDPARRQTWRPRDAPPPSASAAAARDSRHGVFSESVEPVPGPDGGAPLGYLTREASGDDLAGARHPQPPGRRRARGPVRRVGERAWTDLARLVPPPVDDSVRGTHSYEGADRTPASAPSAKSPARPGGSGWSFRARPWWRRPNFLRRILVVAARPGVVCGDPGGAVCLAGHRAADRVHRRGRGHRQGRLHAPRRQHRRDEIGRLTRAFDTMGGQIESAQQRLLHDLEARTHMEEARRALEDQLSKRRRWKPSAAWPAASRTTSTTC